MKLNKDWYYYRFVGTSDASFGTSSYSQHRQRRKAFNRFFSLSAILDHEKQVRKCVLQLCARLDEHRQTNRPVVLGSVFRSLATDVISQYALPEGFNFLSERDLGKDYHNVNRKLSGVAAYNRHLPFIIPTLMVLPTWLVKLTATPGMVQMLNFQSVRALVCCITSSSNVLSTIETRRDRSLQRENEAMILSSTEFSIQTSPTVIRRQSVFSRKLLH